jgi:hypothetical protein
LTICFKLLYYVWSGDEVPPHQPLIKPKKPDDGLKMTAAKKSTLRFISMPFLLAFSCLHNSAYSYDCTPQSKVESIRQKALSAQNDYVAATQKYLVSMGKIYEMRTAVHECQSGQTITESIFGSCNDVVLKYNTLVHQTNNLESQKDSLKSMAKFIQSSYQTAAALACRQ